MAKFYNQNIYSENLLETRAFRSENLYITDATGYLTSSAPYFITLDGTNRSVNLPDATSLSKGHQYYIANTTGNLGYLNTSDGTALISLGASSRSHLFLKDNTSSKGSWIYESSAASALASYSIFGQYNANASSGRYLQIYLNEDTNSAPYIIVAPLAIVALSLGCFAASTGTVGVFKTTDLVNPIASISVSNQTANTIDNIYAILIKNDQIALRVTSGTISKPYLTVYMAGI